MLTDKTALLRIPVILTGMAAALMTVQAGAASGEVDGMLDEYCTKCHNFEDYSGGIDLEGYDSGNIHTIPDVAEKVIKRLRAGMMPPVGEPRPDLESMEHWQLPLKTVLMPKRPLSPAGPVCTDLTGQNTRMQYVTCLHSTSMLPTFCRQMTQATVLTTRPVPSPCHLLCLKPISLQR